MATYLTMTRDPATGETSRRASNNYRHSVLAARYDHHARGLHVTVIRSDSGNVVVFHGADMSAEMKHPT